MRNQLLGTAFLACFFSPYFVEAQHAPAPSAAPSAQWEHLIDTKQITKARQLCSQWEASSDQQKRIEAEKCLANVALAKGSHLSIEGNESGGGSLGTGYSAAAVDAALIHLNKGISLAPQDLTLHEGRLHVLEVAGRYDDMMRALEESIETYKGPNTPQIWLAYAPELAEAGEPTAGLHLCQILDKHYPNNSDIIGNLGAFHNMLRQWDQGLPYVRKAAEMHPTDPIDTWNLGWSLNHLGQYDEANKWLSRSIELDSSSQDAHERSCLYGQFLIKQMKRPSDGCKLVKSNCEQDDQKVCP